MISGFVESRFDISVVIFVLKKYWNPFRMTTTMKIAHKNISMMETSANNVLSRVSFSELPPAKAFTMKYPIKMTTHIISIARGLMNSSILPSIQSKIPLTWLKPTLEGEGEGDGSDTCAADINGMKWNEMN